MDEILRINVFHTHIPMIDNLDDVNLSVRVFCSSNVVEWHITFFNGNIPIFS